MGSNIKVAFSGDLLLDKFKTGIGWLAHNYILELAKSPELECVIQVFWHRKLNEKLNNLKVYDEHGVKIECCEKMPYALYSKMEKFVKVPYGNYFKSKQDIMQFFNYIVPSGFSGKSVVFIHDMVYKIYPEYTKFRTRHSLNMCMPETCKNADHIITISENSKREIHQYLKVPLERITVIPCAVDHNVYHTNYTEEDIHEVKTKFKIEGEYFFYLGTIEPRKNLIRLIKAYDLYRNNLEKNINAPKLVLAGGRGWLCDDIYKRAASSLFSDDIMFIGYVSTEDAPKLMKGAIGFTFPSIYEGFGMPPLEAMACGTPVLVTNNSSLPEVVGEAGIYVSADDIKDIAEGLNKLYFDRNDCKRLSDIGIKRAEQFSWANSAKKLEGVYKQLLI